ncbi:hypothetical protein BpHYR1_000275 [Brachionus plicatilis]|uniref:Tc1-like transposase DDE domain-containing protein n=1 Tax=Brachionus plicatilis TaxID=10195 RepID=A0A3M7TBW6_BRAPC|nr:hypothetical protein BpHYR1_000275 [Brachionus plicatilis]
MKFFSFTTIAGWTSNESSRLLGCTMDDALTIKKIIQGRDLQRSPYLFLLSSRNSKLYCYLNFTFLTQNSIYILKEYKILYKLIQNSEQIYGFNRPAFHTESNLEKLAIKYGHKVVFSSKFHLEPNPIEGLWCYLKQHITAKTNQTFPRMMEVLAEVKENFIFEILSLKEQQLFKGFAIFGTLGDINSSQLNLSIFNVKMAPYWNVLLAEVKNQSNSSFTVMWEFLVPCSKKTEKTTDLIIKKTGIIMKLLRHCEFYARALIWTD